MKQQLIKITIFIIAALLISLPLVYASVCNCDHISMPCMHDIYEAACGHEKPAEKDSSDCFQMIPCEFMQANPTVLDLVRAIQSDFERFEIPPAMLTNSGPDDFDLTGIQQKTNGLSFFQKGSFFHRLYLTNESFLC